MPVMTRDGLLDQLEALSHVERVRAMIALGRRGDAEARELIAALERGHFYERFLALFSCFGSHDQPHVLRALADPSRLIRGLAAHLAVQVLDDQQAIQAFAHLSPGMRTPLLSMLRGARRQTVVDTCLEQLATAGDSQLLPLLHLGSAGPLWRDPRGPPPTSDTGSPRLDAAARAALYASPIGRRYITQALLSGYSANLLRALPGDARQQEARRLVKRWRTQPERQMQFASCLPWDEAVAVLDNGLHATDASLRAQSLGALIDACAYSRDRLPELLALLQ